MTKLDQFIKVCRKYFVIDDPTYIHVIFGTIFANRRDSDPVWLFLIGPPSSGKTVVLQALADTDEIILRDTVTRPSLVSGYKEKGRKSKDFSLFPMLDGKVLIIKDFTTMLQMKYKDLLEAIGILRAAFDGHLSCSFGNTDPITYKAKFGIIAAVTNAIDKHRGMLSELGARFINYRMPEISDFEKGKRALKALSCISTIEQRKELAAAAKKVLNVPTEELILTKQQKFSIVKIAQVVAKARTDVNRDRFSPSKEPEIPSSEHPTRIAKELGDLVIGVAMARGKSQVTNDEILLIQRVALDCLTLKRRRLFHILIDKYPEWIEISEVKEIMDFSDVTISRWFQDLSLLDLVEHKTIYRSKNLIKTKQFRILNGQMLKRILLIQEKRRKSAKNII